jgi:hypothetical protein
MLFLLLHDDGKIWISTNYDGSGRPKKLRIRIRNIGRPKNLRIRIRNIVRVLVVERLFSVRGLAMDRS